AAHADLSGQTAPYGVVFAFAIACAGHVERVAVDPATQSPATMPFACLDDDLQALGPQAFTFAFMRIYIYEALRNTDPAIVQVLSDGIVIDPAVGVTVPHCSAPSAGCAHVDL